MFHQDLTQDQVLFQAQDQQDLDQVHQESGVQKLTHVLEITKLKDNRKPLMPKLELKLSQPNKSQPNKDQHKLAHQQVHLPQPQLDQEI